MLLLIILVSLYQLRVSLHVKYTTQRRVVTIPKGAVTPDPNFEEHLPSLLKAGVGSRASPELGQELRKRFQKIGETKRKAARALSSNPELAVELSELALELEETSENFIQLATTWDAWNRPSPDLPKELRKQKTVVDPNFEANLPSMFLKGKTETRPDPDLPSALRMLKYKNTAQVQRLAAKSLRENSNVELATELEEIADEIEESHSKFEEIAADIRNKKRA